MANLEAGRGSSGAPGDVGIRVFRDKNELCVGEVIGRELLRAIDNSMLYTPIFSRICATSKWCLHELARILPIFVDVEPADVKLKTSLYGDALLEHEKKFPEVKAWRKTRVEVNEIKGRNLQKDEGQGQFIKLVVEEVLDKLKVKHKPVTEHLVGLTGQIEEVMKLLDSDCGDVWLIGIHGMGGIGKITASKIVFNQLCLYFEK